MDSLFWDHAIWQPIINILTCDSFTLGASENEPILTHTLTALRATCRTARAMIPAPTHMKAHQLLYEGAKNGNEEICQLAINHSRKDYKLVHDALYVAIANGYKNIMRQIMNAFNAPCAIEHYCKALTIAAKNGYLDTCQELFNSVDYKSKTIYYYQVAKGAAMGRHLDIIHQVGYKSPNGLFVGAVDGYHLDLCEMILETYDVNLLFAAGRAGKHLNFDICLCLRNYAIKRGLLSANFYSEILLAIIDRKCKWLLYRIHELCIRDGILPNYTAILAITIFRTLLRNNDRFVEEDRDICGTMRELCKNNQGRIDYNEVLTNLHSRAKIVINDIRKYAKKDGFQLDEKYKRLKQEQ